MNIGEYLMRARKRKGLSQEEVANSLNVSRQSVSLWECDQTIPTLDNLIALSKLYETSVDILTGQKSFEVSNEIKEPIIEKEDNEKQIKVYKILSISFTIAAAILIIVPILSTMVSILSIVFSINSMKKKKTNLNLFTLIFGIVFLICGIYFYFNMDVLSFDYWDL